MFAYALALDSMSGKFSPGQAYVPLTRVKTFYGLHITKPQSNFCSQIDFFIDFFTETEMFRVTCQEYKLPLYCHIVTLYSVHAIISLAV